MNNLMLEMYVKFRNLVACEEGQDLVEYALAFSVIALATTASMQSLALGISNEFTYVGTYIGSYV